MKIKNDVSSFKGFAVQAVRDCVKESHQGARKAFKGTDLQLLQHHNNRTLKHAVKAFRKGANNLELRGVYAYA